MLWFYYLNETKIPNENKLNKKAERNKPFCFRKNKNEPRDNEDKWKAFNKDELRNNNNESRVFDFT